MKTKQLQLEGRVNRANRGERGSITVVFIALLAIMMILVVAECRALIHLRQEVKFLEQQQIKRLNSQATRTIVALPTESR